MREASRRRAIGQILLLSAGFLVLVAISIASVLLVNRARNDNGMVVHTVEVENAINTLLLEVRRAESAARGYLLTSGPEFLRDHEEAVGSILPDTDKLEKLTADNSIQDRQCEEAPIGDRGQARAIRPRTGFRQARPARERDGTGARGGGWPDQRDHPHDGRSDAGRGGAAVPEPQGQGR